MEGGIEDQENAVVIVHNYALRKRRDAVIKASDKILMVPPVQFEIGTNHSQDMQIYRCPKSREISRYFTKFVVK